MTAKRPREESDGPTNGGPVSKIAAVNPNWAQLKAKLNSHPRRRKNSETNEDVRTSGKRPGIGSHGETEKPVTPMDGTSSTLGSLKRTKDDFSVTDVLAIDCEMVGVGSDGSKNALARVTLVLFLSHPKKDVRDTSVYKPLRSKLGRPRALRDLAAEVLGVKIQENEHNSVEDARAAMFIYQKFKKEWEKSIRHKGKKVKLQAK